MAHRRSLALVCALPKEFREHHSSEMSQVFRDCCRHAYRHKGVFGLSIEVIAGTFDLLINAVRFYWLEAVYVKVGTVVAALRRYILPSEVATRVLAASACGAVL